MKTIVLSLPCEPAWFSRHRKCRRVENHPRRIKNQVKAPHPRAYLRNRSTREKMQSFWLQATGPSRTTTGAISQVTFHPAVIVRDHCAASAAALLTNVIKYHRGKQYRAGGKPFRVAALGVKWSEKKEGKEGGERGGRGGGRAFWTDAGMESGSDSRGPWNSKDTHSPWKCFHGLHSGGFQ